MTPDAWMYVQWSASYLESQRANGPGTTSIRIRASIAEPASPNAGTSGFDTVYDGENQHGEPVHLEHTRVLEAGETIDLTPDIQPNYDYFEDGPGYSALD